MFETEGRFLSKAHTHAVTFVDAHLSIDNLPIIRKDETGRFVSIRQSQGLMEGKERWKLDAHRARLDRIADLLNVGKTAEAIFLANMFDWHGLYPNTGEFNKAGFNEAESRDSHGQWAKEYATNTLPLIDIE